jgi:pyruvate kinase
MGPAIRSKEKLHQLADNGMTVVRLNFSHGTHEMYEKDIAMIRAMNKEYKKNVKILVDLEGHRIRIGALSGNKPVTLTKKQKLTLTQKKVVGNSKIISIDYPGPMADFKKGLEVYIDDGNLTLTVLESKGDSVITEVKNDYVLKAHKGVNVPAAKLHFLPIEEKDKKDVEFGIKHKVDYIANSFVRNREDMMPIIEMIAQRNAKCQVIAKIEDREGIDNLIEIIDVCDGIMVARGDLGISVPIFQVPIIQKYIIQACRARRRSVITATQMLESMVTNPVPTRAEVSDVANAIIDGSDFVMLSAETAVGAYPVKVVKMMHDIAAFTEKNIYRSPLEN